VATARSMVAATAGSLGMAAATATGISASGQIKPFSFDGYAISVSEKLRTGHQCSPTTCVSTGDLLHPCGSTANTQHSWSAWPQTGCQKRAEGAFGADFALIWDEFRTYERFCNASFGPDHLPCTRYWSHWGVMVSSSGLQVLHAASDCSCQASACYSSAGQAQPVKLFAAR
jgi:hypothetical protein